jgi:hypothetical protein
MSTHHHHSAEEARTLADVEPCVGCGRTLQPPPGAVPYSQSWHVVKIVVRSFSLALAIALVSLSSSFVTPYGYPEYKFAIPVGAAVFLWDAAEFVTLGCRRRRARRGIHPAAHVAVELAIVLFSVGAAAWLVVRRESDFRRFNYTSRYGNIGEEMQVFKACVSVMFFIAWVLSGGDPHLPIRACSLADYSNSALHGILFIRACKEVHQRRRSRGSVQLMFVPGGGAPFNVYGSSPPAPPAAPQKAHLADLSHEETPDYHEYPASVRYSRETPNLAPPEKEIIPGLVR